MTPFLLNGQFIGEFTEITITNGVIVEFLYSNGSRSQFPFPTPAAAQLAFDTIVLSQNSTVATFTSAKWSIDGGMTWNSSPAPAEPADTQIQIIGTNLSASHQLIVIGISYTSLDSVSSTTVVASGETWVGGTFDLKLVDVNGNTILYIPNGMTWA